MKTAARLEFILSLPCLRGVAATKTANREATVVNQASVEEAAAQGLMFLRIRAAAQTRLLAAAEHRRLVLEAHERGISVRKLAQAVGERPGTVHEWIKQARLDRQVQPHISTPSDS